MWRELACVFEQEGDVGVRKDAVASKSILLRDSDDLGKHVAQPSRVNEVEVVKSPEVVVVVQENAIVVKELCRCGKKEKKETR